MKLQDQVARDEILAKLAQSRAEIRRLLDPPPDVPGDARPTPSDATGEFPRSKTMRMLLSSRGLGAVGAVAGGLLLARPGLAWRLIRLLPASAVARMLLSRAISKMHAKTE